MWFEILLVFILFKFKKRPNISRIRVVQDSVKNPGPVFLKILRILLESS